MFYRGRQSPLLPPSRIAGAILEHVGWEFKCVEALSNRCRQSSLLPPARIAHRDLIVFHEMRLLISCGGFVCFRPRLAFGNSRTGCERQCACKFCLMEADGHRSFRALFNRANSFKQRRMVVVEHRIDFWRHYFGKIFAVQFYECR